jgi:hypothetical protein
MIFGFNTDVRYGATIFHVQSEPRYSERLLQTQVFVGGRCIGKLSTSYASHMCEPGFFEEQLQDMLKGQHRAIVDAAREGRLYDILRESETPVSPGSAAVPSTAPPALALDWVNAKSPYDGTAVQLELKLTQAGDTPDGATVTSRLTRPGTEARYAHATADQQGCAVLRLPATEADLSEATVVVQAKRNSSSVTKKFRLKRA